MERTDEMTEPYRALFDSMDEGFCILQLIFDEAKNPIDFLYLETNAAFERHVGFPMQGRRVKEVLPDYEQEWLDYYGQVALTGKTARLEHKVRGLEDQWFQTSAFRHGPPENLQVGVIFSNVTDRKLREKELLDFNARLETAVRVRTAETELKNKIYGYAEEIGGIGTWTWNPDSDEAVYSDNMYRLLGLTPGEVVPNIHTMERFVHPEDWPLLMNGAKLLRRPKFQPLTSEYRAIRKDGEVRTFRNRVQRVKIQGNGEVIVGITEDVTELRDSETKNRELRGELLTATVNTQEAERKRIAESLHNGIGQMLYGIQLNLALLALNPGDVWTLANLRQHRRTYRLVTEAIAEARSISHKLMPSVLEDFGLKTALRDLCLQFQGSIRIDTDLDLPDRVTDYISTAIYRIVQELITNTVRHAEATRIFLRVACKESRFEVEFSDDGLGFNEAKHADGIGLKSIRETVAMLGGTISVNPETRTWKAGEVTDTSGASIRIVIPEPRLPSEEGC